MLFPVGFLVEIPRVADEDPFRRVIGRSVSSSGEASTPKGETIAVPGGQDQADELLLPSARRLGQSCESVGLLRTRRLAPP